MMVLPDEMHAATPPLPIVYTDSTTDYLTKAAPRRWCKAVGISTARKSPFFFFFCLGEGEEEEKEEEKDEMGREGGWEGSNIKLELTSKKKTF